MFNIGEIKCLCDEGQDEKACLNLRRLMLNMLPLPRASERIQIFLTLAEKCKWKIETLMMDLVMDQTGLDLTALGMEDNGHIGRLFIDFNRLSLRLDELEEFKREKLEELKRIWRRNG